MNKLAFTAFRRAAAPARSNFSQLLHRNASFQQRSFATYLYAKTHEYITLDENDPTIGIVGISDFAQSQLGDVVYVDLPAPNDPCEAAEAFGIVESVKAASDVYSPVSGTVLEVNEELESKPELVNEKAMTDAWFIKIKISDTSELDRLLDEAAYQKLCQEESA